MATAPGIIINLPGVPYNNLPEYASVATLRAVPSGNINNGDEAVVIAGALLAKGGVYTYSATSLVDDDGLNVLKPNDITPLQAGRWLSAAYLLIGGPPGNPGGNAESVGTFAQAKLISLDPTGGVSQVKLTDRAKATFTKTTATLDPAGQDYEWFADAAGKQWQLTPNTNVNPQALGALSGSASTPAISRSLVLARDTVCYFDPINLGQNPGVLLEPGTYLAGDIDLSIYTNNVSTNPSGTSRLLLHARIPGTVNIIVPAGKWFLTIDGRYSAVSVDGINFIGGAGAFKFTNTGNNVNAIVAFTRCEFYSYTVCAIGNMAVDAPYLRIRDCVFAGSATSIGVAWGGYCDLMEIEGNVFLRNKYHLKIGPRLSGSITIRNNDFIKNGNDFVKIADIWIIPNNDAGFFGASSGQGSTIAFNKFGNESLSIGERRILIAAEDTTSGTDRLSYQHSTASAPGYVSGFNVFRNTIVQAYVAGAQLPDGNDAPFIGSYCTDVLAWKWSQNSYTGGRHQWLAFFYFPIDPYATQVEQTWQIDLESDASFQYGVVNMAVGSITDRGGAQQADQYVLPPYPTAGDDLRSLLKYDGTTSAGMAVAGGGSLGAADTVDQYGGSALQKVTFASGSIVYGGLANLGFGGQMHWIELQLGLVTDPTRRVREVTIDIRNFTSGQTSFTRTVQVVNNTIGPIAFVLPAAVGGADGSWQWRVYPSIDVGSTALNQIALGRVFISVGKEPINTRTLRTTGSAWNTNHLVLGNEHVWVDATGKIRYKAGVPTADLQGSAIPGTAASQPNSTATTVAGLVTDFNTLLANLRASGAIGP